MHRHVPLVHFALLAVIASACAELGSPTAPSSSTHASRSSATSVDAQTRGAASMPGPDACNKDTTAPSLFVELSETRLWPANHRLVAITAAVSVTDECDPDPKVILLSVESSEEDDGLGGWDRPNDVQNANVGTDDRAFSLRAERSMGGFGREYSVVYQATDAEGNSISFGPITVLVPVKANQPSL